MIAQLKTFIINLQLKESEDITRDYIVTSTKRQVNLCHHHNHVHDCDHHHIHHDHIHHCDWELPSSDGRSRGTGGSETPRARPQQRLEVSWLETFAFIFIFLPNFPFFVFTFSCWLSLTHFHFHLFVFTSTLILLYSLLFSLLLVFTFFHFSLFSLSLLSFFLSISLFCFHVL